VAGPERGSSSLQPVSHGVQVERDYDDPPGIGSPNRISGL